MALVLSPMRPSKKRPSATVPTAINVNTDGDTPADAVFDTGCTEPEPRHVQKRKREAKQPAASASAALLSGQNMSDVNGATAVHGTGPSADLQGEEALPLGSRPKKERSNAKVSGSSSGSAGPSATNGSVRPRATRKVASRGVTKSQKAGGKRRETRAVARPVPRSGLAASSSSVSRSLLPSSSSAAVKPKTPPSAPRAVAKDPETGASAIVSNPGHEQGALTSRNNYVVGNIAALAVENSQAEAHSTTAHTARRAERREKGYVRHFLTSLPSFTAFVLISRSWRVSHHIHITQTSRCFESTLTFHFALFFNVQVTAPVPPPTKTHPAGFKFHLDARLEARKVEYQAMTAELTASRPQLQHSKSSSTSTSQASYKPSFSSSSVTSSSSLRAGYRKENVAPTVTIPVPFDFQTAFRAESRAHFDEWAREKEREREREEEERRREREEQEEREVKEMRKRAVPKANEVPGWYKDAPRRRK